MNVLEYCFIFPSLPRESVLILLSQQESAKSEGKTITTKSINIYQILCYASFRVSGTIQLLQSCFPSLCAFSSLVVSSTDIVLALN